MDKILRLGIWVFFTASVFSAFGQSAEESAARSAEQAGKLREAFAQYVAALQKTAEGSGDERRLREVILRLAPRLSPTPAVPEDARRFGVRGRAWMQDAKNEADFTEAVKEFAKALRIAPWWAEGYINHGVALEKAGKYSDAAQSLKMYLLASPSAPDAGKVKDYIYTLEVRQEKKARPAAAADKAGGPVDGPDRIAGDWCPQDLGCGHPFYPITIKVNGSMFEIWGAVDDHGPAGTQIAVKYRGRIEGNNLTGQWHEKIYPLYGCGDAWLPMQGRVSTSGDRIEITHAGGASGGGRNCVPWKAEGTTVRAYVRK